MKKIRFKTSYLEYYKNVLSKVSFCKNLFRKEYSKAKRLIAPAELRRLEKWIKDQHPAI